MPEKHPEFEKEKELLFQALGQSKNFVLATSSQNRTTSRMMSCVIISGLIYMQTDNRFLKYQQIMDNPLVALCSENTQIEGIANLKGHPFEPRNKEFSDFYEKLHKSAFEK